MVDHGGIESAEDVRTSAGAVVDDRFVLVRRLGRGGAATVWLADDTREGDRVAVKLMHSHLRDSKRALERFAREADVMRSLDHPNIVACRAFEADAAVPYLAMDFVNGHSLKQEIGARSPTERHFTTDVFLSIVEEFCSAVAFAHERRILHRDLNAANILLDTRTTEMSVRVVDFGVAKLVDDDMSRATTHGRIIGTPASIAPEQALGEELDLRADIFALGVVLFEMLTLRRAWILSVSGDHEVAYDGPIALTPDNRPLNVFERIIGAPRPDVRTIRAELPEALARVVMRAMALEPSDRQSTATELFDAVSEALDGTVLAEPDGTFVLPRASRRGSTVAPPVVDGDPTSPTSVPDGSADPTAPVAMTSAGADPTVPLVVPSARERSEFAQTPVVMDPATVDPRFADDSPFTLAPNDVISDAPPTQLIADETRLFDRPGVLVLLLLVAVVGLGAVALYPRAQPPNSAATRTPPATPNAAPTVIAGEVAAEAEPPTNRAPVRTSRTETRRRRPPVDKAVSAPPVAPPVSRFVDVDRWMARVARDPSDVDAMDALAKAIRKSARSIEDGRVRDRILRYTEMSVRQSDVAGFRNTVQSLKAAFR